MYEHLASQFFNHPWAVLPETYQAMREVLVLRMSGERLSDGEIRARLDAVEREQRPLSRQSDGMVAVLPMVGTIFPRANMMTEMSGGVSLERWTAMFRSLVDDSQVRAIVLDVDSPGGNVAGVPEAAAEVFAARARKPIVAVANTLAASAAYYIAAQASELVVSPSAYVGSIGVFAEHVDISVMEEMEGVKTTLISAGKFKTEGNPFEPLGDEARAEIQRIVDEIHTDFVKAVARGRGVSADEVRRDFGQGRIVGASLAVKRGMADRVETLQEAVARVANPRTAVNRGARSEGEPLVTVHADEDLLPETADAIAEAATAAAAQLALEREKLEHSARLTGNYPFDTP